MVGSRGYSIGNPIQAYVGPAPLLKPTTGAGWSAIIPSIDVLNSYESGDKRRRWSVMEHGFTRTDWTNVNFPNGFKYDTTWTSSTDDATKIKTPTRSNALKYIVGPGSNGENVNGTSTDICTYLLRYADVLLIYAEATIGTGTSTTDASALEAFNKVHTRAGLSPVTSLTKDQVLKNAVSNLLLKEIIGLIFSVKVLIKPNKCWRVKNVELTTAMERSTV
jgi:hypothetical protein